MAEQDAKAPEMGEKTGRQARADVASTFFEMQGLSAVPSGTYKTYRKMLKDPTLALVRTIAMAPIISAGWTYEAIDKDVPSERVEFIRNQLDTIRPLIVRNALRALDYGWAGFEKVFEVRDGEIQIKKLKYLKVDMTQILVDKETGRFEGFKQDKVTVPVEKSLLFTNDQEGDDYHGQSRLENCRSAWSWWNDANEGAARYDRKIAGVMPVVHYPPGKSIDKDGTELDNYQIAQRLLDSVSAGKGIAVPNEFAGWADDRDAQGGEKRRWIIELLEDKGSRQSGFGERLRYCDALKMRGYLRPERAGLEANKGGIGTTDSQAMTDIGMTDGELLHEEITRVLNWHLVDQLLVLNYGEQARGSVFISPMPLVDSKRAFLRDMIKTWAGTPDGREDLKLWLDIDSVLDLTDLPKVDSVVEIEKQDDEDDPEEPEDDGVPRSGPIADQINKTLKEAMNGGEK